MRARRLAFAAVLTAAALADLPLIGATARPVQAGGAGAMLVLLTALILLARTAHRDTTRGAHR